MDRDEGMYQLARAYDALTTTPSSGQVLQTSEEVCRPMQTNLSHSKCLFGCEVKKVSDLTNKTFKDSFFKLNK